MIVFIIKNYKFFFFIKLIKKSYFNNFKKNLININKIIKILNNRNINDINKN